MKVKRKRDDDGGDEGLEVKIKVRKTQIEKTDSDNTDSENTDSENTQNEDFYIENTHSENTFIENTHSENTQSEKVDNEKKDNEKADNEAKRCAVCNGDDHEEPDSCKKWRYPSGDWTTICPDYCAGTSQSPININKNDIMEDAQGEFVYNNYDKTIPNVNMKNNGHSVTVSWDTSVNTPSISGGGLDGSYTLAQFHFHWGCENSRGSEHTVNNERFAMELHLVHFKTSYGTLGEAIKYQDGLAVLGVFFNVNQEDSTLKPITENLSQITEPVSKYTDADIVFNKKLEDLVPNGPFFRYNGSLTTPTCNEVVVWTVFSEQLEVSQDQIDAFRLLKDHHGDSLCNNYREVQPLNGRTVVSYNSP